MTRPTPIDVWAPAFKYFRKLTPANTISTWGDCKCCDQSIGFSERDEHAAQHDKELRAWRKANPEVMAAG